LAADKTKGAPVQTYEGGFEISGADAVGKCFRSTTALDGIDFGDPSIKFKQDVTYGCSIPYNKESLEKLCKDVSKGTAAWNKKL